MIIPNRKDAVHKAWLYRILSSIADDYFLNKQLRFKGGTCAAMQGFLKRFSVDLDFDLIDSEEISKCKIHLEKIFSALQIEIKDQSSKVPQYFLKYPNDQSQRSIIKIDITCPPPLMNGYEPVHFAEIDKTLQCQTKATMFANKLVALIERYEKNGSIAGRDLFDIQSFYLAGFTYNDDVIKERRKTSLTDFFAILTKFIEDKVTQRIIDEDLNPLLPYEDFKARRKYIKNEVLMFTREQASKHVMS